MRRIPFSIIIAVMLCLLVVLWASRYAQADSQPRTKGAWAQWFLTELEAPTSQRNLAFVTAWINKENTEAQWNPLATTKGHDRVVGQHNSHGVRWYEDASAGIEASVATLVGGYPSITAALRADNQDAALAAPGWSAYSGRSPRYTTGIAENFRTVLQNFDAMTAEPLRSAGPDTPGATVTAAPEHLTASPVEQAPSTNSEPTGIQMRYPLFLSLGIIGGTVILKRRRLQVYGLLSAVTIMLAADSLSERFDFEKVVSYYSEMTRLFLTDFTGIILRGSVGALVLIGLMAWVSSRQGQFNALKQQMKGLWIYFVFMLMRLWDARLLIGLFAAWIGLTNFGAQIGAGKMAGMLTTLIIGAVTLPRIPSFAKGT